MERLKNDHGGIEGIMSIPLVEIKVDKIDQKLLCSSLM